MIKELPRELWLEIFKHFIASFGFMELYKYRKVCKIWCELIIVIMIDKLNIMMIRIKYYYKIIRDSSMVKVNILLSPTSSSSSPPSSSEETTTIKEETKNFISYNYNTESFEYNVITILTKEKNENELEEEEEIKTILDKQKYYKFFIIFHLIHKILNLNLIKKLREILLNNYWLNIEEKVNDNDTKFFQKIIVRGDKLLPYIDQIHDLIDYLNNLTT